MKILFVIVLVFAIAVAAEAKVKCGPIISANKDCPSCDKPPFLADEMCTCKAPLVQYRRKYACGPACDAIGHCCSN